MALSEERRKRLEQEATKNAGGGNFINMAKRDKAVLRLLPVAEGEDVGTKQAQYFIGGHGYTDPAVTHGKPSVIDRAKNALKSIDDKRAQELAKSIDQNFKITYLMKVVDRASPEHVSWYRAPGKSVYRPLIRLMLDQGVELDDPKNGRDFIVSKSGSGKATEYSMSPALESSPLAPTKEERLALRAAALEMDPAEVLAPDEAGALEALIGVIPKDLWKQIKDRVTAGLDLAESDGDASEGDGEGDEEAPAPKTKPKPAAAAPADDDEAPAPRKPAAPPVDNDDDEAPAPKPRRLPV